MNLNTNNLGTGTSISAMSPETRRWAIISVIFFITIVNYLDRQVLSILKPILKDEFALTDQGYALLVNLFTVCYALMYPVSGWLIDKFGARKTMAFGIIGWSIASICTGLSNTFLTFALSRCLLGLCEPTTYPAQIKVITTWFSGRQRATANTLSVAGGPIGAIIAPPFIAWLVLVLDWHWAFIIPGIIGIVIVVVWLLLYREAPANILEESARLETKGFSTVSFKWNQLWGRRSLWGIILVRFITDPVWYFCAFWMPGYLQEKTGLSLTQMGKYGWIPFLIGNVVAFGAAAWSDRRVKRGTTPLRSRKIMLTLASVIMPLMLFIPNDAGIVVTMLKFCVITGIALSWTYTAGMLPAETFPLKNGSSVMGISAGIGAVGAVFFNYLIGQVMGSPAGVELIFLGLAVLHPLGLIPLWTMLKQEKPKTAEN